jgi:hypothetical protein
MIPKASLTITPLVANSTRYLLTSLISANAWSQVFSSSVLPTMDLCMCLPSPRVSESRKTIPVGTICLPKSSSGSLYFPLPLKSTRLSSSNLSFSAFETLEPVALSLTRRSPLCYERTVAIELRLVLHLLQTRCLQNQLQYHGDGETDHLMYLSPPN